MQHRGEHILALQLRRQQAEAGSALSQPPPRQPSHILEH